MLPCLFNSGKRHAAIVLLLLILSLVVLSARSVMADSLQLPTVVTQRGKTIVMPLTLNATSDLAAASLRLEYDPGVVASIDVQRGTLATSSFLMEVFEPNRGCLNILIATETGKAVFSPRSGVLAKLNIKIQSNAPLDQWSYIRFAETSADPFAFPGSSLSSLDGQQKTHQQINGGIFVSQITRQQNAWSLYQ